MDVFLFWVGGVEALAVVTLAVSAVVLWRAASKIRPYEELETALRETHLQLSDLVEHVERKETRERVRKMRDGRAAREMAAAVTDEVPQPGTPGFKQLLRRKAMAMKANGSAPV